MNIRQNELIRNIKAAIKKGLIGVVIGTFLRNLIMFLLTIFIARLISPEDMAIIAYAESIIGFVFIINGLGSIGAFLQFASATDNDIYRKELFKKVLKAYIPVELLFAVIILATSIFYLGIDPKISVQLQCLSFMPLCMFFSELSFSYIRAAMETKTYSRFSVFYAILHSVLQIVGCILLGIIGVALGRILSYLLFAIFIGIYLQHKYQIWQGGFPKIKLDNKFIRFSIFFTISNIVLSVGPYIELWLIAFMSKDITDIAYFKVASVLPNGLAIIPASFAIFFYPYFSRKQKDIKWVTKNSFLTIAAMLIICGVIGLMFYYFAPWLIHTLYKGKYDSVTNIMQILCISFIPLGALRVTISNILLALGQAKFNMTRGIITLIIQIVLDVWLYNEYKILGIAIASLYINIISGLINVGFLIKYCRRNV